jgi:hypothetical protein
MNKEENPSLNLSSEPADNELLLLGQFDLELSESLLKTGRFSAVVMYCYACARPEWRNITVSL